MRKIQRVYVNLIIKTPILFYTVIVLGIVFFLYYTANTHLNINNEEISLLKLIFMRVGQGG